MKPNSLLLWLGVYIVGVITSYIITKLIDRCDEKVNGYHTKDATEEYETGLVIVFFLDRHFNCNYCGRRRNNEILD